MADPHYLEQLLELVEITSSASSFYHVKSRIAELQQQIFGGSRLLMLTMSRTEERNVELAASAGFSESLEPFYPASDLIAFEDVPAYVQDTCIHGTPISIRNISDSHLVGPEKQLAEAEGHQSLLCLPLIARGSVLGVITIYSDQPISLSPDDERLGQSTCTLVANMIERERFVLDQEDLHEQLELLRETDMQTGLYNRRYFHRVLRIEVSRSQRYRRPLSCLMFELDGLQKITELYGSVVSEPILMEFARLLKAASRESDILCYYSTARFALLAVETNEKGSVVLVSRLLELLKEKSFYHASMPLQVTASAGFASMPHPSLQSMEQMLEAAETALHEAQELGGDAFVVYEP